MINKMPKCLLKFLSPLLFHGQRDNSLALWRAFIRLRRVIPSHAKAIWSPWLYLSPEVFLARWRTKPFICVARYTSLHLPQDWDCVRINSWFTSCREAVPTRKLANTSYDIKNDELGACVERSVVSRLHSGGLLFLYKTNVMWVSVCDTLESRCSDRCTVPENDSSIYQHGSAIFNIIGCT